MDVLLDITVLFALALALCFLVERFMEIVKSLYDLLDSRFDWFKYWTKKTYRIRNTLENRLRIVEYAGKRNTAIVLNKFKEKLMNEAEPSEGEVPVLSGDLVRAVTIKAYSKIIGITAGILLAFWMKVDLFDVFQSAMSDSSLWIVNIKSQSWRIVISGAIIGLGTDPLHKFIRTIENRREKKEQREKVQTKKEVAS
ncbi:MAG TPA: hypothetical protein ENN22_11835 [bacterium]|nr:hypothetical protein [bacterium]